METAETDYPVFKGLQKPLEFMGIRGRFLTYAAGAIGLSFVGFIVFSIFMGKVVGFAAMVATEHNLAFYLDLVTQARQHILAGDFSSWKAAVMPNLMQRM